MNPGQKILVLQSDDFGSSEAANRGVLRGFKAGLLTQTNLMVPCAWFPHAVRMARENDLPCGVHLTLNCEYDDVQFGPLTHAPELSRDGKGLVFFKSTKELPASAGEAVYKELSAQVERCLELGITPTHLDAHMAAVPRWDRAFLAAAERLADRFALKFLSMPDVLPGRSLPGFKRLKLGKGTFAEKKKTFRADLEAAAPGLNYLVTHCAEMSPELQAMSIQPGFDTDRETDLAVLLDPEVREWIKELEIVRVAVPEARRLLE